MWRILTGQHRKLEFSLMEAGHTKFSPDWHFRLWKMKWRHITAETLPEIFFSVSRSSRNGHNLPQLVQNSEKPVVFYSWSAYFDEFFKKLPNMRKYHHFKMMAEVPGVVHVKEYTNTEEIEINIMKRGQIQIDSETLPDTIIPKGLDAARQ